jgi:putative ABC transport system permease protein
MTRRRDFPPAAPPKLGMHFLGRLLPDDERTETIGDLEERFHLKARERHAAGARVWFWLQVLHLVLYLVKDHTYWSCIMFKSNLIIAWRNIKRTKACALINIAGLAIGFACFLAIFLYVRFEMDYDNYHRDGDRVYRVATIISSLNMPGNRNRFANISGPAAPTIKENFPQVEKAARFLVDRSTLVKYQDKNFYENNFLYADQELFDVFTIPVLKGDVHRLVVRPGTLAITEGMARKYFGNEDPVGKTIRAGDSDFEITGVIKDPPRNTHVKYNFIASLDFPHLNQWQRESWTQTNFYTYLKFNRKIDVKNFEKSLNSFLKGSPGKLRKVWTYFLQPLRDIHLHSDLLYEIEPPGNPVYLYIFAVIGAFILLIAAVNFVNLTTARSTSRVKEVGLRKVIGAHKKQLIRQFLGESLLLSALAVAIAVGLVSILLPYLGRLTGIEFRMADLFNLQVMMGVLALTALIGLGAGFYPALFLSGFSPILTLKGVFRKGSGKAALRRSLVVIQFAVAVIMVISTLLVYSQLRFMKNAKLGFDKEQKLVVSARLSRRNYESIKNEFLSYHAVKGATASSVPGRDDQTYAISLSDKKFSGIVFNVSTVDKNFLPEYKLEIVAGEWFQKGMSGGEAEVCLINETGAKVLGFDRPEHAVGKFLQGLGPSLHQVMGVLKDFHYRGLQQKIDPLVFLLPEAKNTYLGVLTMTLETKNLQDTLKFIENKWKELKLGDIYSYRFLDEDFSRLYQTEEKVGRIFGTFTALGLLIAFLGLFGLALLTTEQRTKEIGIRKVLGATVPKIFVLLTREFIRPVAVGILIAFPIAYYAMHQWLQNFAYRTEIGWLPFAGAAAAAVALSLLTVSFQALKSAAANPADAIRYE